MMKTIPAWELMLARVFVSFIFIFSGVMKITGFSMMVGYAAAAGIPLPTVAIVIAIVIEVGAGLGLLFGYQTFWSAKALAIFVLVAALFLHRDFSNQMEMGQFMKNLAIAGGLLFIAAHGPGAYSCDAKKKA